MFSVYILKNESGKYYIGQTSSLDLRFKKHNENKIFSTKNRGPWILVYKKQFYTRAEAMQYEKYLKSLKGGQTFKNMLKK